jgi:hypothetical protein
MAIPAGISTALVHLDAPVSFIGEDGRIHATITSSIPLVWAATGTPIGNFIENVSLDPGVPLELNLPHVDQGGFLDGAGNTVTGWSYRIEVTYEKDGQNIPFPARDFQILSGQLEVDLALIPSGEAYIPVVAPILPVTSIDGLTGEVTMAELALDRVDNTNDLEKPVSTAAQAALNLKADSSALAAHTGNVANPHAVTKAQVGLGSVDNTTDLAKPISTATQAALNGKAPTVHGHTYADISGTVPTSALPPLAINETTPVASQAAMLALVAQRGDMAIRTDSGKTYVLASDSPSTLADWKEVMATGQVVSVAGRTGVVALAKADVGLGSVDNTADSAKPISAAQQAALDLKLSIINQAVRGKAGRQYAFVAGVIRNYNDGLGWRLIDDGFHPAIGITTVDSLTDTGLITVNYPGLKADGGNAGRTVTLLAQPDETLTKAGFTCGVSVEADKARIQLQQTRSLNDYLYWDTAAGAYKLWKNEFWGAGRSPFTIADTTNNHVRLTHAQAILDDRFDIDLQRIGGPSENYLPVVSTAEALTIMTQVVVDFYTDGSSAATRVTAPDTKCRTLVRRGQARSYVPPADVHEGTYANGNIWLFGIMQDQALA